MDLLPCPLIQMDGKTSGMIRVGIGTALNFPLKLFWEKTNNRKFKEELNVEKTERFSWSIKEVFMIS